MQTKNQRKMEQAIRKFLVKIRSYIKEGKVDPKLIEKELRDLINSPGLIDLIIKRKELGILLFRELRKYLKTHLDRIDISIAEFVFKSDIPLLIYKWVYSGIVAGRIRITSVVKLPNISAKTIRRGLIRLRSYSAGELLSVNNKPKNMRASLRKLMGRNLILRSLWEEIGEDNFGDLFVSQKNDFEIEVLRRLYYFSREEFILRLLALVKYNREFLGG